MFYERYFGLQESPFSITPDPRYLYLTKQHEEALAHLSYGVRGGGFVLLTGEIGSGKTTICRRLLEQLPQKVDVAVVLNPRLGITEFLQSICEEYGLSEAHYNSDNRRLLVKLIYKHLLHIHREGRSAVLIIDEAQNLDVPVLEYLRLLTNLETNEKKLLQIMLVGQPELRDIINSAQLKQLAQRISARFHLQALSRQDVGGYIRHRLKIAGSERRLFDKASIAFIGRQTRGMPRLINTICDRALLGAYVNKRQSVTRQISQQAAREVLGAENTIVGAWGIATWLTLLMVLGLLLIGFLVAYFGLVYLGEEWLAVTACAYCGGRMHAALPNCAETLNTRDACTQPITRP